MTPRAIYIAAPWGFRAEALKYMLRLEKLGWTITHKWPLVEESPDFDRYACAKADLEGVLSARVLWVLGEPGGRGTWTELGIGLGSRMASSGLVGMDILVSGPEAFAGNIFSELADVRYKTHELAFKALVA